MSGVLACVHARPGVCRLQYGQQVMVRMPCRCLLAQQAAGYMPGMCVRGCAAASLWLHGRVRNATITEQASWVEVSMAGQGGLAGQGKLPYR